MTTVFDYLTMAVFAGLIVLFLQRSVGEGPYRDALWQYLVPSVGCALSNYLGNEGMPRLGALALVGTLAFIFYVLKPLGQKGQP